MGSRKKPEKPVLREQLILSSTRFAGLAVRDYLEGRMTDFFVHSGTSLEQLAKAYLASFDPTLVVDGRSFDSLLHASGHGRHSRLPLARMRTISANEALERCGKILPSVANLLEDLRPLVDARNGAIHVGHVDDAEKGRMLLVYLRASRQLLGEGGWSDSDYWGEFGEFVARRVAEESEAAEARVEEAVTAARLRFAEKYAHLADAIRPAVLRALEESNSPSGYDEQRVECPVCGTLGQASGSTDVEWEADFDVDEFGDAYPVGAYPIVTFVPAHFYCKACELELDGQEEILLGGIEESWQLDDVNPADFVDWDEEY